jgi:hypothetical protein
VVKEKVDLDDGIKNGMLFYNNLGCRIFKNIWRFPHIMKYYKDQEFKVWGVLNVQAKY